MNNLIAVLVGILAQLTFPTPDFPDLVSPTPWQSPTPAPTSEYEVLPAQYLATATAIGSAPLTQNGTQAFYNGNPLLPDVNSSQYRQAIGYAKWIFSSNGFALLGPFGIVALAFVPLVLISLVFAVVFIWENYIGLAIKAVLFLLRWVLRFVRGLF